MARIILCMTGYVSGPQTHLLRVCAPLCSLLLAGLYLPWDADGSHFVVCTSIECFAAGGRTVMGAILFLLFQRLQGDPVSCLLEPFGKQSAHPTPGKNPETFGLLPGALATWTWGSCRQEVLCVPRFGRWCFRAHWFREIRSWHGKISACVLYAL